LRVSSWVFQAPGEDMVLQEREAAPAKGEVLVQVAGCGVCHTDLGFFYDGVPTRHPLPLTLGHEVSGVVVACGEGAESWLDKEVVVPAVIPCGECPACRAGRGSICPKQIFPGNDVHGGFASHLVVPATGLCPVPDLKDPRVNPGSLALHELSVIADAVSTPYQAIHRSGLCEGDLALFVGIGGVGGFGVQIAKALGAHVVAIDVDEKKLARFADFGADLTLNSAEMDFRELKKAYRAFGKERDVPTWRRFLFETSGHPAGQSTAFGLLEHGSYLSVVGYTPKKVELRLSNLMALDARAEGNWGCLPELYPPVLDLVLQRKIALQPFIETRSLATINETFQAVQAHEVDRRVILVPGLGN
jgi:6-hydroxycyclohex-1-ene-1-carbonyl-CoA dehydrogenase